jgi:hypothetical protein
MGRGSQHSAAGGAALPYRADRRYGRVRRRYCEQLSVNRNTVILWRKRFAVQGLDGLWDVAPGRGTEAHLCGRKNRRRRRCNLQTKPAGVTHWSRRTMAQKQGVSKSTVNNIWRAHNLQPQRTETFKLSRDPKFLERRPMWWVLESATTGNRALRRRKEPDSGAGSHPAGIATQDGLLRRQDPGLQAQRNHYPVRRFGNLTRQRLLGNAIRDTAIGNS